MRRKNQKSPTAIIARKYKVTTRTVRNWRAEGAPLSDPSKLSAWLASRKHCPKVSGTSAPEPPAILRGNGEALKTGAAAALHRLETAEAEAYTRLESALQNGDAIGVRNARESWLRLCHNLRLYEAAVAYEKRDRGLLIEKSVVELGLRRLGMCLQAAGTEKVNGISHELAGETDLVRMRAIIRKTNYQVAILSYAFLESQGCPRWMVDALDSSLVSSVSISREEISKLADMMKEAMAAAVSVVVASEPHLPPEPHYEPPATATATTANPTPHTQASEPPQAAT